MPVVDSLISASFQVLFDRLASRELLNVAKCLDADGALKKLASTASKIKAVLQDAEEKHSQNAAVKLWLNQLDDVLDEAENVLDEAAAIQVQVPQEPASDPTCLGQVHNLVGLVRSNASAIVSKVSIVSNINDINKKLDSIAKESVDLGLREDHVKTEQRMSSYDYDMSTSLVGDCMYGRGAELMEIKKLLLRNDNRGGVGVIPIVGLGGVGKTAVVQVLYNDPEVKKHFNVQAWACVSNNFDLVNVTKGILESLDESCNYTNLEPLQRTLTKKLIDRRCLIVLDDVWTEDYDRWEVLLRPLRVGARGSTVIVTTRNEIVAQTVRSTHPIFRLKELSEDDCWSLLKRHAFANIPSSPGEVHKKFEKIGKQIVKMCKGLPLAAKLLRGLLRSKLDVDEWQDVLNSDVWMDSWEQICGILSLSYSYLPSHLKPCFAYCAIFPKGYKFEEEELVHLWIAHGFVQRPEGNKQIEDIGRKYFRDMLSRSLFQHSSESNAKSCFVMHDLINDLAQFVGRESCLRLEGKGQSQNKTSEKVRHFSFIREKNSVSIKFEHLNLSESLRTFWPLDGEFGSCRLSAEFIQDLPTKHKRLRVLSLTKYMIAELPNSIGELKHLRYLNLANNGFTKLPDSIAKLYNLQTLILYDCRALVELPTDTGNLSNLRHLDITGTKLQALPPRMGRLKNLQTLTHFIVGDGGSGIQEVKDLVNLQGEISILGLQNVKNAEDAGSAELMHKQYLNNITLEWNSSAGHLEAETLMNVLERLKPHRNLASLCIRGYGGAKFSSWLGDPLFSNIESITLSNCKNCTSLPALGQLPSLKELTIEGMDKVGSVGHEFYGDDNCVSVPFRALETLKFSNMRAWEKWSSPGGEEGNKFPCLHELHVDKCPKLSAEIPNLPFLEKLEMCDCKELKELPRLQKLVLKECDKMILQSVVRLGSIGELRVCNILKLEYLPEGLLESLKALEDLEVDSCDEISTLCKQASLSPHTSLRRLTISNCPLISTLTEAEDSLPCTIECLKITRCNNLKDLSCRLQDLTSLAELRIIRCPNIKSFSDGFPPMLRHLEIQDCEALLSLPEGLMHRDNVSLGFASLEFLHIGKCSSLRSFPEGELPTYLKQIKITGCLELVDLPRGYSRKTCFLNICAFLGVLSFHFQLLIQALHLHPLRLPPPSPPPFQTLKCSRFKTVRSFSPYLVTSIISFISKSY